MTVHVSFYKESDNAFLPTHNKSEGFDIYSAIDTEIYPSCITPLILTNITVKLPDGFKGLVSSRRYFAEKYLTTIPGGFFYVLNNEEVKVSLVNYGTDLLKIKAGEHIANLDIVNHFDIKILNREDKNWR